MTMIDQLRQMPDEYQLQYCWARAVEWQMLPAFVSQPIVPILYVFYPWKFVLLAIIAANFVWNLVFCTAIVSLPLAGAAMMWAKLKWVSLIAAVGFFAWRHQWLLTLLTVLTPICAAFIGQLIVRRSVGVIQEFFMLQLGHVKTEPSPEIQNYLSKRTGR